VYPEHAAASALSRHEARWRLINEASAELALERRRFEMLLGDPRGAAAIPARRCCGSPTTAGDLAAHLSHALKHFATLKSSQLAVPARTDWKQSLPSFIMRRSPRATSWRHQPAPGTDLRWMLGVQRSLTSITCGSEQLMKWLRGA